MSDVGSRAAGDDESDDTVAIQEVEPSPNTLVDAEDPDQLLLAVLLNHADAGKWVGSPYESVKRVSNTKVGSVGQDFLETYASQLGFTVRFPVNAHGEKAKRGSWDIEIDGIRCELKTATEDINGKFQFNHIRYHRKYDALICLGISPTEIFFGVWSKAAVTTGDAGNLVSMEKSANASYKLTKSADQLFDIVQFAQVFSAFRDAWKRRIGY